MADRLEHLIGQLEAFFRFVADQGDDRTNFDYAFRDEDDEAVIELTYRPTGRTRRYDVNVSRWSVHAVADFRRGRFQR